MSGHEAVLLAVECRLAPEHPHALRLAGVSVATLRAMGQLHGFGSMTETVPSAQLITRAAAALMGDALRKA